MKNEILLKSIYENCKIKEPILIEFINHPIMQRLKNISMGGTNVLAIPNFPDYSRFEHSINVLILLIKYEANLEEQIAGLLHDASHTVFSHVGDFLFKQAEYQDNIHEWYLKELKIDKLLEKYNLSLNNILHKTGIHKLLEQDLPDICIDRLEYNLFNAFKFKILTKQEIWEILENLKFENNFWFFDNPQLAAKFANISLYMTQNVWASAWGILTYKWTSQALEIALKENILNIKDINFSTDNIVLKKLKDSKNKEILEFLNKIKNNKKYFEINNNNFDQVLYGKFRGIDPLIKHKNNFIRLTELDQNFAQNYNHIKNLIKNGWKIVLKNHDKQNYK
ncbi:MAG: HD domain-containing protein [Candidatus Babeliales bacterium]